MPRKTKKKAQATAKKSALTAASNKSAKKLRTGTRGKALAKVNSRAEGCAETSDLAETVVQIFRHGVNAESSNADIEGGCCAKASESPSAPFQFVPEMTVNALVCRPAGAASTAPPAVFTVSNVLRMDEATQLVQAAEAFGFTLTKQRESTYMAHRENGRLSFVGLELADILWDRVKSFFPPEPVVGDRSRAKKSKDQLVWVPVGLSDNWRLYRYTPGERFGLHIDESVTTSLGHATRFTLLFYLNGTGQASRKPKKGAKSAPSLTGPEVSGGETAFYTGDTPQNAELLAKVAPMCGSMLAHLHGDECLLHEGCEVRSGVKYLLRTDVAYELKSIQS